MQLSIDDVDFYQRYYVFYERLVPKSYAEDLRDIGKFLKKADELYRRDTALGIDPYGDTRGYGFKMNVLSAKMIYDLIPLNIENTETKTDGLPE